MGRDLTIGERKMAREIYGKSIRYSEVKIHHGKFFFTQPPDSGMTPHGAIYASDTAYHDDYSKESASTQGFFIHEMGHVWQYQNGVLNPIWSALKIQISHSFNYGAAYAYRLDAGKTLINYNMEQQASILEDYFRVVLRDIGFRDDRILNDNKTLEEKIELLKIVLADFLDDPFLSK